MKASVVRKPTVLVVAGELLPMIHARHRDIGLSAFFRRDRESSNVTAVENGRGFDCLLGCESRDERDYGVGGTTIGVALNVAMRPRPAAWY
jgi:hypothetical protein